MSVVEVRDARKVYPLGKVEVEAVRGVSFSIGRGDFVSIAGPSGSGKSTILNMIGLIDTPTSGEVLIQGAPISSLNDKALTSLRHRTMGFIFQSFNLVPVLNVRENIEFPLLLDSEKKKDRSGDPASQRRFASKAERKEWLDWLIEEVGLTQWMHHRSNELSGGQRQRVAIARALVCKPDIVLADEPTANLDSATGAQILDLMKKINRDMETTFIFSTHDARIVDLADHVIRLKDGLITENYRCDGVSSSRSSSAKAEAANQEG